MSNGQNNIFSMNSNGGILGSELYSASSSILNNGNGGNGMILASSNYEKYKKKFE